jgi:outer membrane receptor protein involved in Fe transport
MKRLRRMKKLSAITLLSILATFASPFVTTSVMAQATTGSLKGSVTDASGAVIPDADVTARNTATGTETKTKSNGEGIYTFAQLQPGTYLLTIEKQNFKKAEFQQVLIQTGQTQSLDAVLQAGQVSETVSVTAQGEELLQKEQAQVSTTFESRKVAELPSNIAGGGIDTLALLAPGVIPGFGNVNSNGSTLSVNGNRARSNNFTIDGQDNNDLSIGGPAFFVDNQDTVSEFQIVTNNFSAEYGRNLGAIVNISTKSGTNDFHGTAAWFHRDRKALDALTNIERRAGNREDPPARLYNVYSGTLGGPVIKDRAWFFGSYQRITDRQSALGQSTTPTIAVEELSRLSAAFPTNPAIQALVKFSAFANTGVGSVRERADKPRDEFVTIAGVRYRVAYPEREIKISDDSPEWSARGDVNLTSKHHLWYRHLHQFAPNHFGTGTISSGFLGNVPASGTHSGANLTSQITNTSVNEFRFVFSRLSVIFGGGCDGPFCVPDPADIGNTLTNINFSGIQSQRLVNGVAVNSGNSLQTIGPATNLPQGRKVSTYQFADNFSKTFGVHQLKLGADVRHLTNSVPFLPNVNGAYRFNSAARLVNNAPSQVQLGLGEVTIAYNENDQFYYFQDDWRVKDNLTLNLGVRYEYTGQPVNTIHDLTVARESNPSTALFKQSLPLEARTFPKIPVDKNNFAPRLGFAYRPNFGGGRMMKMLFGEQDKTVIRGGYAIAYDPGFYNIMLNVSTSSPAVFLNTTVNPAAGTPASPILFPLVDNPTGSNVASFATSKGLIVRNTFDPRFFSQTIVSGDFHAPYSQQWSLGVQREISRNNVIELRYVGNHAVGLFQTLNRNPRIDRLINGSAPINITTTSGVVPITFPGFPNLVPTGVKPLVAGTAPCVDNPATTTLNEATACAGRLLPASLIRSRENTAQSTYNGLQARYQGRMFNQLSLGVSYAFSKTLDNASEIFSFNETATPQNPFDSGAGEKGLSGNHRAHAGTLNFLWDIPVMKEQHGILGRLLGGWQLNGIYYLASGQNFTPQQFGNVSGFFPFSYEDTTSDASFFAQDALRPFSGSPNAPRNQVGISQIDAFFLFGVPVKDLNGFYSFNELNTTGNAVTVTKNDVRVIYNGPGAARIFKTPFGNISRGSETGPILNDMNMGIFKNIRLTEKVRLQLRADGYNIFNHVNPGVGFNSGGTTPSPYLENAGAKDGYYDFGGITGARRAWQLGAKIIF